MNTVMFQDFVSKPHRLGVKTKEIVTKLFPSGHWKYVYWKLNELGFYESHTLYFREVGTLKPTVTDVVRDVRSYEDTRDVSGFVVECFRRVPLVFIGQLSLL
jgi:hypothetical protein